MKIIFLDIDGVLNNGDFLYNQVQTQMTAPKECIDRKAVMLLNQLIDETGAKVVISSSWRLFYTIEELREYLSENGFEGEVIDYTEDLYTEPRGKEIKKWLDTHKVESFVILDDDGDMAEVAPYLIQTDFYKGLLEEHVDSAVKMLKSKSPYR